MNSDAAPHLSRLAALLSDAYTEADQAVGHLARWQHGSALDLRDAIGGCIRNCRGLTISAGLEPPEEER